MDEQITELKKIIKKKQILLVGATERARKTIIDRLIEELNFDTFRLPKNVNNFQEYDKFVKRNILYKYSHKRLGGSQIWELHLDWINENDSFVVIEEAQKREKSWKLHLMRQYTDLVENHKTGKKFTHLIVSQDKEDNIIENLANDIYFTKKDENRTKRQIIEGSLKVFEI